MLRSLALAALLALAGALPATFSAAQEPPRGRPTEVRQPEGRKLPPDSTTEHVIELPGRTLRVTATAGALPLTDPNGVVQAEIGYVAYRLAGPDAAARPVTFAVNGGPGSASAYLHLLAIGPWRLPLDGSTVSPSAPPVLVPNAETWLDFTDLVFLDPVGTGYSRATGSESEIRDRYYGVEADVASLSAAIARWLRVNDRLASPKFFMGESYGGFRGPLVARKLQTELGIGLSGLVLVSPVLDFGYLSQPRHAPFENVARLPSLAAAHLERRAAATREALAEAERYAAGEYLLDLTRGVGDREAVERVSRRVAELTGLDPTFVRRRAGRLDMGAFAREFRREEGREVSIYDTGVSSFDPDPAGSRGVGGDPLLTAMQAPLTSAIVDHLWRRLGWVVPNQRYELSNGSVGGAWRYGRGRRAPDAVDELKEALALDPDMRVMVSHGLTDLVTPYFASELILRQVPAYGSEPRLALTTYPGGHMYYTRAGSRAAFRTDGETMYRRALDSRGRD